MANKKREKNEQKFECLHCDYNCCYLSDWSRHILTSKHKRLTDANIKNEKNETIFYCDCGNNYKHKYFK